MTSIFADTSFFIALVDRSDQHHAGAVQFLKSNHQPLITTSAIVLELGAFFSDVPLRPSFLASLHAIEKGKVEVIHVGRELQSQGIEYFGDRPDKDWSLTDCISFVVMKDRDIRESATSHRHFKEAGFIAILRNLQNLQ